MSKQRGLQRAALLLALAASFLLANCAQFWGESSRKPLPNERRDAAATHTLLAVGDIAFCADRPVAGSAAHRTADLAQAMLAQTPSARVLTLGDNVYEIGTPEEFANCYEPTWGRLKSQTWATPGNHDYGVREAHGYFAYFGAAAGPERRGYYHQMFGQWLVLSLNSNIDSSPGSAQYRWLEQVLAESSAPCVLAAWHHPVFSSSSRGNDRKMAAMFERLERAHADLILQGHQHHFERFAPMRASGAIDDVDGVLAMVVGTGGAPLSRFVAAPVLGSIARIRQHGVLQLALEPRAFGWQFVDLDRQTIDQGRRDCKPKKPR